jgi:hypothetical protein
MTKTEVALLILVALCLAIALYAWGCKLRVRDDEVSNPHWQPAAKVIKEER